VPSDFLPPDPYADAPQSGPPGFVPPNAPPTPARRDSNRAVVALGTGAASLGLLVFTAGMLFVVTLPASIVGWVLGKRAKQADPTSEQANVAVIMGIVGTILSAIATAVWIAIWTKTG